MSIVDTYLATHEWGIVANNRTARHFRVGAKLRIETFHTSDARVRVSGLSIGGRRISKWVKASDLENFRAAWFPDSLGYGVYRMASKEEAMEAARHMGKWGKPLPDPAAPG